MKPIDLFENPQVGYIYKRIKREYGSNYSFQAYVIKNIIETENPDDEILLEVVSFSLKFDDISVYIDILSSKNTDGIFLPMGEDEKNAFLLNLNSTLQKRTSSLEAELGTLKNKAIFVEHMLKENGPVA